MGQVVYLSGRAGMHAAPDRARPQSQPRILLVYPHRAGREYLAVFLVSRDCHVTACSNGKEALAYLGAGQFELVVTGILMPQMDGLELVRSLRRQGGPPAITVTDGAGKMDAIYQRSATLCGAVAAHTFAEAGGALLDSVHWILRGREDVIRDVVW
jgi:CheY-like chemotaxis protein